MANPIVNSFTSFELNEEEATMALMYTPQQLMFLQNQKAEIASAKLAIEYDPQNPNNFHVQHIWYSGRLVEIDYLIQIAKTQQLPEQPTPPKE